MEPNESKNKSVLAKSLEETMNRSQLHQKMVQEGLNDGTLISMKQIGFTKEGNIIVNLYNSEVCYDLTANKEVSKDVVDPTYKVSEKTLAIFNDGKKMVNLVRVIKNGKSEFPLKFIIKLSDLIEIAQSERVWKKEERDSVRDHDTEVMKRMSEMIEATYGKVTGMQ